MTLPASNYTQVPNLILDNLRLLKEGEVRCILCICRETIGFHHAKRKLSLTYLQEKTGLSRQGVLNGTGSLLEKGWIDREKVNFTYHYWLNVTEELVNEVDQSTNLTSQLDGLELVNEVDQASQLDGLELVNEVDTYKERESNKDDLKKGVLNKDLLSDMNAKPEQVQVEPVQDKKRKDMASQSEKPKSNRKNKNEVTNLDREELQPLLDLYNQEKPARWDTAKSLTPSRVRNLRRLIKDHKENTVSVIRRGLIGAKRRNTAQYNWSIDTFIKEDNDWCTVYAESVSEDELLDKGGAAPSIDINSLSKEQKAEYERKSNLMAFYAKQQQKNGGTAA